jgi:hypothetical protein
LNLIQKGSLPNWQCYIEQTFFEKLKLIQWKEIFARLLESNEDQNLSSTQVLLAFQKYERFLFLIRKYPYVRMVPNQEIDSVLHAHIANIHEFERDCQNLFSVCLKHLPGFGSGGDAERLEWQLAFSQTQELFELNYGQGTMGISAAASCEILWNCSSFSNLKVVC